MTNIMFRDRRHAGRSLASVVQRYRLAHPIVLAVPPGGVPVAAEIARALEAPLDLLVVCRLSLPDSPHRAIGAIAPQGAQAFDEEIIPDLAGVEYHDLSDAIRVLRADLRKSERHYRKSRPYPDLTDRDVVLVNDGMATGVTMLAAVRAVHRLGPAHVYVAVPAASRYATIRLHDVVDDVICLDSADAFLGIGCYYFDFAPTSDEEVRRLLEASATDSDNGSPDTQSTLLH